LETCLHRIVVTRPSSPRALDADVLAAVAVQVFGSDRVDVESHLPDAIELAIELAEANGEFGGAGVLVTGSVVLAGEARRLLG
jgi:dihydrofolate synthase/folylpolyglutamate synthase